MLKAKQIKVAYGLSDRGAYLINAYHQKQEDIRRAIVKHLLRGAPAVVLMCSEKEHSHYRGSLADDGFLVLDLGESVLEVSLPFSLSADFVNHQVEGAGL